MWPTIHEYESFELGVVSSLGLSPKSFLKLNEGAVAARHHKFCESHADTGIGCSSDTAAAKTALLRMLCTVNDTFSRYFIAHLKAMPGKPAPSKKLPDKPKPAPTTTINAILSDMGMDGSSALMLQEIHDKCATALASSLADRSCNTVAGFTGAIAFDTTILLSKSDVVKQTAIDVSFDEYKRSLDPESGRMGFAKKNIHEIAPPYAGEIQSEVKMKTDRNSDSDEGDDDDDDDRLRVQDVIDDLEMEENMDLLDDDNTSKFKMKVGLRMMKQDAKTGHKRKRDHENRKVYTSADRKLIAQSIRRELLKLALKRP